VCFEMKSRPENRARKNSEKVRLENTYEHVHYMEKQMNERIRELAEQAGFQYIKDERIGWAGNYNASLPKFAELIVRECASVGYESSYSECALNVSNKILEHFGVQE